MTSVKHPTRSSVHERHVVRGRCRPDENLGASALCLGPDQVSPPGTAVSGRFWSSCPVSGRFKSVTAEELPGILLRNA